jgi:hypothetical protein
MRPYTTVHVQKGKQATIRVFPNMLISHAADLTDCRHFLNIFRTLPSSVYYRGLKPKILDKKESFVSKCLAVQSRAVHVQIPRKEEPVFTGVSKAIEQDEADLMQTYADKTQPSKLLKTKLLEKAIADKNSNQGQLKRRRAGKEVKHETDIEQSAKRARVGESKSRLPAPSLSASNAALSTNEILRSLVRSVLYDPVPKAQVQSNIIAAKNESGGFGQSSNGHGEHPASASKKRKFDQDYDADIDEGSPKA